MEKSSRSLWPKPCTYGGPVLLLVLHAAFDVAELEHGEGDHEQHQDHRLRRGAAEVEAFSYLLPCAPDTFPLP